MDYDNFTVLISLNVNKTEVVERFYGAQSDNTCLLHVRNYFKHRTITTVCMYVCMYVLCLFVCLFV